MVPSPPGPPVAFNCQLPSQSSSASCDPCDLSPQSPLPSVSHPPDVLPPRTWRLPARYRDYLPELPRPIDPVPASASFLPQVILHIFDSFCTSFNRFGIAQEYRHRPSYDPDHAVPAHKLSSSTDNDGTTTCSDTQKRPPPFPWPNMSIWRLMAWQLTGNSEKSSAETTRLVHDILLAEDFKPEDLSGFNAQTAIKNMDRLEATPTSNSESTDAPKFWDGWKTNVDVDIQVPSCEKCRSSERCGRIFTVHGFAYRPLVPLIRAAFMEAISKWFHLTPFKRIWKSPVTGREQ
ncbi:hypothetical protein PISMIDRAFT_103307 [Pisolithus microcarpus 441]|uniref:Uncharacterized protein n=1 Tax=Pisolithus microcarpus 441 TaxID=765257 RepID=A0A0C9YAW4_9AGAM|nr:hypothetical protein PISMIDRAFT_103307 [Pisolithus microcarpus 441]